MELSIATNNHVRAVETSTAQEVFPEHIQNNAKKLMLLIKEYYKYLNVKLSPSYEINNMVRQHDVDLASDRYLDAIERTIASNIPRSRALDRPRLFKMIANYYNSRGSEESIFAFFRIFYSEIVTIVYPKEYLLQPSTVRQGQLSSGFRLRDSYKWQEFSYVIGNTRDSADWRNEFIKFIHPAGLKFFIALTIECIHDNDWVSQNILNYLKILESSPGISLEDVNMDDYWEIIDWDANIGKHSPRIQANVFLLYSFLFVVYMGDGGNHYLTHIRSVYGRNDRTVAVDRKRHLKAFYELLIISYLAVNQKTQIEIFHNDWIIGGKFRDSAGWGEGWAELTIEQGDRPFQLNLNPTMSSYGADIVQSFIQSDAIPDYTSGDSSEQEWYTVKGAAAKNILYVYDNFNLNDTITIGDVVYTWQSDPNRSSYELDLDSENQVLEIVNAVQGTYEQEGMAAHPLVKVITYRGNFSYAGEIEFEAREIGVAGNDIATPPMSVPENAWAQDYFEGGIDRVSADTTLSSVNDDDDITWNYVTTNPFEYNNSFVYVQGGEFIFDTQPDPGYTFTFTPDGTQILFSNGVPLQIPL